MPIEKQKKLDANESVFFSRQLETIKSKTYDVKYANLKARTLIPVSTEGNPGAETITYRQYDATGMAKIISDYAKDLPRADVKAKEFTSKVKSLGASYAYSVQEIRAARFAGVSLEQRKANAAKRSILQKENNLAFFGDSDHGLVGFINNPNIGTYTVPNGAGGNTEWSTKTADEILADLNGIVNKTVEDTKGVDPADTLLLPVDQYTYIASTPRSSTSDTTILEYFLRNNPFISAVDWLNELAGAGAGGSDMMLAYRRDPDYVQMEVPQDFEQFPVQENGLEYEVPCHSRFGGVSFYYPLSASKGEGI